MTSARLDGWLKISAWSGLAGLVLLSALAMACGGDRHRDNVILVVILGWSEIVASVMAFLSWRSGIALGREDEASRKALDDAPDWQI